MTAALIERLGHHYKLSTFINGPVNDYFIGEALVELGEPYPYGEARHGYRGVFDYWYDKLGLLTPQAVVGILKQASKPKPPRKGSACPCRSGKIVRKCHRVQILWIQNRFPTDFLLSEAESLAEVVRIAEEHANSQKSIAA
ncbi:MAG: hypothetical protein JST12_13170 [Armatimonadetes bacterium]|nr:hypothetical protein [Armatimonadota bacterium]